MVVEPVIARNPTEVSEIVRRTFSQTWNDYYAWKPPSVLPLADDRLLIAAQDLDEQTVKRVHALEHPLKVLQGPVHENAQSPTPDGGSSPLTVSPGSTSTRSNHNNTGSGNQNLASTSTSSNYSGSAWKKGVGKHQPANPVEGTFRLVPPDAGPSSKRVPPYSFCVSRIKSGWTPDEKLMPFMPPFPDEVADKFNEVKYKELFDQRGAWAQPGREPDVDIIQVETLHRLQAFDLSKDEIDKTRVLPSECRVIENLDLVRDLPPFPSPVPQQSSSPSIAETGALASDSKKRKWHEPLSVEEDLVAVEDETDLEELHCFRPGCLHVACRKHTGLVDGTLVTISHSHHHKPEIKPKIPRPSVFPPNSIPCSGKCFATMDQDKLQETGLASSWSEIDRAQLADFIVNWKEMDFKSCCDLGNYFLERTCQSIAMEILAVAELEKDGVQQAGTVVRQISERDVAVGPSKTIRLRLNAPDVEFKALCNFEECNHDGPCIRGKCICANANWTCGRNCGCPPSCQRRFRGCDCRRIERSSVGTPGGPTGASKRPTRVCVSEKCPCVKAQRECDPELCGGCGAREELDACWTHGRGRNSAEAIAPSPASDPDDKQWLNCSNVQLQKANWPKLRVGISRVAGYGLFADEDIEVGRMLGEYVGEIVSPKEGEKRTLVGDLIGRQYIFAFNADYEVDSANYGNITRFINSGKGTEVNCDAGMRVVRDDLCIVFYASRHIRRHEEIRFDYGVGFAFEDSAEKAHSKDKQKQAQPEKSGLEMSILGRPLSGHAPKKSRLSRSHG